MFHIVCPCLHVSCSLLGVIDELWTWTLTSINFSDFSMHVKFVIINETIFFWVYSSLHLAAVAGCLSDKTEEIAGGFPGKNKIFIPDWNCNRYLQITHTYNCECTNIFNASGRNAARAICSSNNLHVCLQKTPKCNTPVLHFLQLLELNKRKCIIIQDHGPLLLSWFTSYVFLHIIIPILKFSAKIKPWCACVARAYSSSFVCLSVCLYVCT